MLHLMTTPRVYRKLKAVVQQAVNEGVSSPIKQEEAKKIPYLQVITYNYISAVSFILCVCAERHLVQRN